jgi:ABC-type bacteriocin/lantibiotic exporter with double-glycine peptidase domain
MSNLEKSKKFSWSDRCPGLPPIDGVLELPKYSFQYFFKEIKGVKLVFWLLTLGSVVSTLFKFFAVYVISQLLSNIQTISLTSLYSFYLPLALGALLAAEFVDFFIRKYGEALPAVFADYNTQRFFRTLIGWNSAKLTNFSKEKLTRIVGRYFGHVSGFLGGWTWSVPRHATTLTITLSILAYQNHWIFLAALIYMALFLTMAFALSRKFAPYVRDMSNANFAFGAKVDSMVLQLNLLRRLKLGDFFADTVAKQLDYSWTTLHALRIFHARRWLLQLTIYNTFQILTIFYGAYQVKIGELPLGFLLLLKWAFDRLSDVLIFCIEYYVYFVQQEEDSKILSKTLHDLAPALQSDTDVVDLGNFGQINLKNISIDFPKKDGSGLINISIPQLMIKRGDKIGIKGPSGSGKSTILGLLQNGISYSGEYLIDGHRVAPTQTQIFGISQTTSGDPLFKLSVLDNIVLGRPVTKEKIERVLAGVKVSDFMTDLNAEVGAMTFHLSTGQEQRVRLARGLLEDAELFLLDEAFSGLDASLKSQVIQFVESELADKTVIVVSHDPEDFQFMDKIFELRDGRLAPG